MPGIRRSSRRRGIPRSLSCVICRNFYRGEGRETCSVCHNPPRKPVRKPRPKLQRKLGKYEGRNLQALINRASVDGKARTIMATIVRNFSRGASYDNRRERTLGMANALVEIIKGEGKVGITSEDTAEFVQIAKDACVSELPYTFLHVFGAITVDRWNLTSEMHAPVIECYYSNFESSPQDYEKLFAEPFVARHPLGRLGYVDLHGPPTLTNLLPNDSE